MPELSETDTDCWRGELELGFHHRDGRTVLADRRHLGPLRIQRPFYPEGPGVCHAYVLHPPGGVVGGDTLHISARAQTGAHALLTTPAAGKFYRSSGATAHQVVNLCVQPNARLEWLPQETIVFAGAKADLLTRVDLTGDAEFLGWEILCLGRSAAGEGFDHGNVRQRFEIWRENKPLLLERISIDGGGPLLTSPWGLRGFPVTASLIATGRDPGLASQVRDAVQTQDAQEYCSVTQLDDVVVCRYLGLHAAHARHRLSRAWEILRPMIVQRPACAPRIWFT